MPEQRSSSVRPRRHPRLLIACASALLAVAGTAWAFGPRDALDYRSPELELALRELAQARWELGRAELGLSGGLDVVPFSEYAGSITDPSDAAWDVGIEVGASVAYRYNRVDILSRRRNLVGAERRLSEVQRNGVRDALLSHAQLLRAQHDVTETQAEVADARAQLAGAELRAQQGEISDANLERERLDLQNSLLALEQAENALEQARAEAARYGFDGEAEFAVMRFNLPETTVQETYDYRWVALELEQAEAERQRDSVFGIVDTVRLETGYETTGYEVFGSVSLQDGNPGAGVQARYRFDDEDAWKVRLSATLHFDDTTVNDFAAGELSVSERRQQLAEVVSDFETRVAETRANVSASEEQLALRQARLALNDRERAELEARIDGLDSELVAARSDTRATLAEELEQARGELRRLESERLRELDGLYFAWLNYVRAVGSYLDVTDGHWQVE